MSLFSATELNQVSGGMPGYRLQRLEWLNWGTFDGAIATLDLDGHNTLLTGDIGSGKSTIVDAITTLLLRADRISYNKAAGAETRERDLRSYVLGHWKSEHNETTGRTRPVGLRGETSYSVLLAVFANVELEQVVTLAQVFWFPRGNQGQPERFYAVDAGRKLSIDADFTGFGSKMADLRKRLKAGGTSISESFPDYEKQYRRALGVPSAQAMELFHQTVSMKSVGDLNKFVRSHMLEPFDAAASVQKLIRHFDDLTAAHDAVVKARTQLSKLAPLIQACDDYDTATTGQRALLRLRGVLRQVADRMKHTLLTADVARLSQRIARDESQLAAVTERLTSLRERKQGLREARAGLGGGRLGQIEALLPLKETERDRRRRQAGELNSNLIAAQLPEVHSAAEVADRLASAEAALSEVQQRQNELRREFADHENDRRRAEAETQRLGEEIRSLQDRRSNIPKNAIDLRERLFTATGLTEEELPFVGELVQVRDDERRWQGAAERVLRGFGLSLVVRETHYPEVSSWINDNHLGSRLVYLRVRDAARSRRDPARQLPPDAEPLFDKLEVSDTDLRGWLLGELQHRADHACVESMAQFRRLDKAVTLAGQVKSGNRHEKDDRHRVDDPSNYVLGWSNAQKIDALLRQATEALREKQRLEGLVAAVESAQKTCQTRHDALTRVATVREAGQVDWWSVVSEIADLEDEKRRLEASSSELQRITDQLEQVTTRINTADGERDDLIGSLRSLRDRVEAGEHEITRLDRALSELPEPSLELAGAATARLGELKDPQACDRAVADAIEKLEAEDSALLEKAHRARKSAERQMRDFRFDYPTETTELDDAIESAGEYRELQTRLATDDLPRFEAEFKRALNTETIREIGTFAGQLRRQRETIRERIEAINDSLSAIDYNAHEQTYICLEARDTPNTEVREFIKDLRECTSDIITGGDDQYSEQKFLQVSRLIARFKGREGQAEHDRGWTRYVTDVRNWFEFMGSERFRSDSAVRESFSDSDGKSGGQKEKLAYTILAASLAYQFKLEPGAVDSKTFRFAVIDEAFGRGSDVSTRYALDLFGKFGLQLLVVTPLQKVHVIEPYVARVGFAANPTTASSSLLTMTISEYRENRRAFAAAGVAIEPD